jgi:hypothetical protein
MKYSIYEKQDLWTQWVRQPIYIGKSLETAPRSVAIQNFVKQGLLPFVREKGYTIKGKADDIAIRLLQYMFALYLDEKVVFQNPWPDAFAEDIQEFDDQFDSMELERFWDTWGYLQDFQENAYAEKLRYTLPAFVWTQIDLENSSRVIQMEKIFQECLEMETYEYLKQHPRAKEDPYLHDTSKVNYEDRHWH